MIINIIKYNIYIIKILYYWHMINKITDIA